MKKFLLMALTALAIAAPANAYTVDDLVTGPERGAIANYNQYAFGDLYKASYNRRSGWQTKASSYSNIKICDSEGLTIERDSDTSVIIRGIGSGDWAFRFYITDDRGNIVKDGTHLTHYCTEGSVDDPNWRLYEKDSAFLGGLYENSIEIYDTFTLNMSDVNNGEYPLSITSQVQKPGGTVVNHKFIIANRTPVPNASYYGGWNVFNNARAYSSVAIEFYRPNAEATDNYRSYDWNVVKSEQNKATLDVFEYSRAYRQYPLLVEQDGNTFYFTNLGNNGNGYDDYKSAPLFRIKATLNTTTNQLTFAKEQAARMYPYYTMTWNQSEKYTMDGKEYCDTTYDVIAYPLYWLEGFYHPDAANENVGECRDELLGTYTPLKLSHNDAQHSWVTNRGKRKTFNDFLIHINPYTYYYPALLDDVINFAGAYFDTNIQGNNEVTLDVELELSEVRWHGDDGVYMVGNVKTNKNDQYVDHYDVMIVKGKWDHIEQTHAVHGTFQPCPDYGHVNARVLCDHRGDATNGWGKQNAISLASNEYQNEGAGEHDYQFAKLITPAELGAENLNANGKVENSEYTAFIRAIYKPETGLTPTFHDMKYLTVTTPTGVSDLAAEGIAPTVVAVPEGIAISGTERTVQVVNTLGAVLYQGPATTVSVAPGMYIVRAGSYSTKVLVK